MPNSDEPYPGPGANGTGTAVRPDLSGRRVLVPGGTGGVGEGVVRRYLAAAADVVVPTRTEPRAAEFRRVLGDAATDHLHLVVHDYTTFAGAAELADEMTTRLGGIDDVVTPIGGFWEIDEDDWRSAFVALATAHMAVLRAVLPRLSPRGAYSLIVGASAFTPVPTSGLVSMEQAALAMMQQVAQAESGDDRRVFVLVLGPVNTRAAESPGPDWVTPEQVGAVAVAASAATVGGQQIGLRNQAEVASALTLLQTSPPSLDQLEGARRG
jgi:NAD(P)-dependent dehydrogenase (short-subunit alcohol dehydrogenase family)